VGVALGIHQTFRIGRVFSLDIFRYFAFVADINVGKLSVVQDPRFDWVWESPKGAPSRVVSLFTCNPDAPHVKGSSTRNIVVQATRVS
jgi:hypothetical protein